MQTNLAEIINFIMRKSKNLKIGLKEGQHGGTLGKKTA